jgi:hypothetical protein
VFGSSKACAIDKYNISIKNCIISLELKTLKQLAVDHDVNTLCETRV